MPVRIQRRWRRHRRPVADLDPATTMFVVSSKTFTTIETLTNVRAGRLARRRPRRPAIAKHFVAVTTNAAEVAEFGIDTDNMFGFWDWVGGRYSVDSAIGFSLMMAIGAERFRDCSIASISIDEHFPSTPLAHNLPSCSR